MLQQRFACARLSHPYMTRSSPRLLTITFTTAAFGRSSSWLFEASPYRATPKGLPSSFVQLRITVWTGDARDTRMTEDMQVRNLSPHTQASYLQQVSLLARHFGKSPDA